MEHNITIDFAGHLIEYASNNIGNHETLMVDSVEILNNSGELGPWMDASWRETLYLDDEQKDKAQAILLNQYVCDLVVECLIANHE